jgi:hypothetical protein
MEINELTAQECSGFLERASLGRLGCSFENQPYVVPVHFAYNALGERQMKAGETAIEPLFFRIRICSMSGLHANGE